MKTINLRRSVRFSKPAHKLCAMTLAIVLLAVGCAQSGQKDQWPELSDEGFASTIKDAADNTPQLEISELIGLNLFEALTKLAPAGVERPELFLVPKEQAPEVLELPEMELTVSAVFLDGGSRKVTFGVVKSEDIGKYEYVKNVISAKGYGLTSELQRVAGIVDPRTTSRILYFPQ